MATPTAHPPADLPTTLDLLFEPSPTLHSLIQPLLTSPPPSIPSLITLVHDQLTQLAHAAAASSSPDAGRTLNAILGSHPRLGQKRVDSALSRAEQAASGLDDAAEAAALERANEEYEGRFPGLRYVVFVNGRPRSEIFADMRRRIDRGDRDAERREAIEAMTAIAFDRARKLKLIGEEDGGAV